MTGSARSTIAARGVSLVEATLSMLVLSLAGAAGMNAIGQAAAGRTRTAERADAASLAADHIEQAFALAYVEPGAAAAALGLDTGESATRSTHDDADDAAGLTQSPPRRRSGAAISGYTSDWSRQAAVVWCDPNAPGTDAKEDINAKRLTIDVRRSGRLLASFQAVRTRAGDRLVPSTATTVISNTAVAASKS